MVKGCCLKKPRPAQQQVQDKPHTSVANTLQHPVYPGARANHVPKQAHQIPIIVPSAPKLPMSPQGRTTQVPRRAEHRFPTSVPSASKLPVSPRGRTTQVPQPRAATGKLRRQEQQSHCSPPSSDPPAPTKPQASSAGSQGLQWLSRVLGQPQVAQPRINSCPLDWVPVPPPRGTPSNPWLSQGCARSSLPAKPLQQPLSAQSTRTPCLEQKHTAASNGMQKTGDTDAPPGVNSTLPDLAGPTPQYLATSDPKELPLLCHGTHLLPHARFKIIL